MLISHCWSSLAIESSAPPSFWIFIILRSLTLHIPECSPTLFLHELVPVQQESIHSSSHQQCFAVFVLPCFSFFFSSKNLLPSEQQLARTRYLSQVDLNDLKAPLSIWGAPALFSCSPLTICSNNTSFRLSLSTVANCPPFSL